MCKSADLKSGLQAKSIIDTSADDTFVKLDRDVGNNSRSGCIGDGAIGGARSISEVDEEIFRLDAPISTQSDLDPRTDLTCPRIFGPSIS